MYSLFFVKTSFGTKKGDLAVAETIEVEQNWIYILDLDGKERSSTDEILKSVAIVLGEILQ